MIISFIINRIFSTAFIGFVLWAGALPAMADLLEYRYTSVSGVSVTVKSDARYINPDGEMSFLLNAGVDRRVAVAILDNEGVLQAQKESDLIGSNDRIEIDGSSYYAKEISLLAPGNGEYVIVAKIMSSAGDLLKEDTYPVVIENRAPSHGRVFPNEDGYGMVTSGSVWKLGAGGSFKGRIVLEGISSPVGIDKVEVQLFRESGELHSIRDADYDKSLSQASFRHDTGFFPWSNLDETFEFSFVITDVAGNVTVTPRQRVRFDNIAGAPSEPYAVYDPSYSGSVYPGLIGYRPYSPGMYVKTNPIKLLWKISKEHWHEFSEGGLTIVNSIGEGKRLAVDSDYVYIQTTSPYGNTNGNSIRWSNFGGWGGGLISYNLKLHSSAPKTPVLKRVEYNYSDIGWDTFYRYEVDNTRLPVTIKGIRAIVEPRSYTQHVEHRGSCSVPPGSTSCYIAENYTMNPGTTGYIHNIANVFNPSRTLRADQLYAEVNWNDKHYPEITDYEFDQDRHTLKAYITQPSRGSYFDRLRLSNAWLEDAVDGELEISGGLSENNQENYTYEWDLRTLKEGHYSLLIHAKERHGPEDILEAINYFSDQTAPDVAVTYRNGSGSVRSLDEIVIHVIDKNDENPKVSIATISGGPANESISLDTRPAENGVFKLEYPIIFPSLEAGEIYSLEVVGKDSYGNEAVSHSEFMYQPPQVELSYGDGYEALLPAISMPFYRPNGERIIESKPLILGDGSSVVGEYELIATLRSDSEVPMVIDGKTLQPGGSVIVDPAYNFSEHDSKISVTAYPAEDGLIGTSSLLLSTSAPNAPVLLTNITTWLPDIALTSERWEVKQLVDLVDIRAESNSETTCRVTMDPEEARAADPIADPVCLMEWTQKPIETEVVTAGSGEGHISKLFGNAITLGDQDVAYELFLFSATGEKMKVGEGSRTLSVVDASDSVHAAIVPELEQTYRHIRPISGVLREESRSRCSFFSTAETAKTYGQTIPYDSPQLACHLDITALPDGVEERPGSRPAFSGYVSELGEASISWDITAFSRTGVEVLVGRETHPFDVIEPPVPEIDFITDNSERRAFETEDREPGPRIPLPTRCASWSGPRSRSRLRWSRLAAGKGTSASCSATPSHWVTRTWLTSCSCSPPPARR